MRFFLLGVGLLSAAQSVTAALDASRLEKFVDTLELTSSFNPVKEAYWTGYPHHRRTPFAVSPNGNSAYIAYLDSSETGVAGGKEEGEAEEEGLGLVSLG
ncbi:hypothetical protein BJX99DRAFT_67054 [Aspergillus californicus]